jgi:hypothetical protein
MSICFGAVFRRNPRHARRRREARAGEPAPTGRARQDWSESRIIEIRDFLFAPYVLEAIDWVRLG